MLSQRTGTHSLAQASRSVGITVHVFKRPTNPDPAYTAQIFHPKGAEIAPSACFAWHVQDVLPDNDIQEQLVVQPQHLDTQAPQEQCQREFNKPGEQLAREYNQVILMVLPPHSDRPGGKHQSVIYLRDFCASCTTTL